MFALSDSLVLVVLLAVVKSKLKPDKVYQDITANIRLCINMCERSQTKEKARFCLCTTVDKRETNASLAENYRRKVVVKFEKWPTENQVSCVETSKNFANSRVQFARGDIGRCVLQAVTCGKVKTSRKGIEMECVSCQKTRAKRFGIEMDHYCQAVNGYTVCSFHKDGKACTCTTKTYDCSPKNAGAFFTRLGSCTTKTVNCSLENTVSKLEDLCSKLTSTSKTTIELPKDVAMEKGNIWIKYTPFCAMAWDNPINARINREKKKCHQPLKGLWKKRARNGLTALRTRFYANSESINCFSGNQKMTPIMFAAQVAQDEVYEHLLYLGADLSAVSKDGWNVIHYAATSDSSSAVRRFVDLGFDPDLRTTSTGKTPLHLATETSIISSVISYLLRIGCDFNAVTNRGQNVLHLAALNNPKILRAFRKVKLKHLLYDEDMDGKTPVDLARERGNYYLENYVRM